ncbi:IS66 family insertion sequence element accessory protein TnpB, partial [Neorhizobium huautlense]|uniref:IS66 family insertion sequence element accessory protein TnpB n=1 Tax=Neorhizobium huautlense TaxID=67774 RepID=UPI00197B6671
MIPAGVKVFLASHPIDFRRGPDSLLSLVRDAGSDPFNGSLYVFRAKRAQLPTFCIRFPLFDDCLSLAPAVREESAGLTVQAWQKFNLHL